MFFMFFVFLLLFAFNLAVLGLIIFLGLCRLDFIFLVFSLETVFGGLVHVTPHIADDLSDFSDLGSGVVGLDTIVHFTPIQEKCGECTLGCCRLN